MTVCIHDDDDGGACDYALYWKGNPKYPFADESAFGEIVLGAIPERDFADCSLMVQFDNIDRAELGCDETISFKRADRVCAARATSTGVASPRGLAWRT